MNKPSPADTVLAFSPMRSTALPATLDRMAPPASSKPDFAAADAFVWHADGKRLEPVTHVNRVEMRLLKGIDRARDTLFERDFGCTAFTSDNCPCRARPTAARCCGSPWRRRSVFFKKRVARPIDALEQAHSTRLTWAQAQAACRRRARRKASAAAKSGLELAAAPAIERAGNAVERIGEKAKHGIGRRGLIHSEHPRTRDSGTGTRSKRDEQNG